MELGKESKMVRVALTVLLIFVFCGPATAQDLPPEVLADQYMVEGIDALENGEGKQAIKAFRKIEALDTEPPAMFPFFYGKALVENSTIHIRLFRGMLFFYGKALVENSAVFDDLLEGQSLIKQFVIDTGKDSEHYAAALRLLSVAGRSLPFAAVATGQAEAVRASIAAGADVNAKDGSGGMPLHEAARGGHAEVVRVLIDAGAAVDARDELDRTPLHRAARKGHADVAQVLIAAGAAVDARDTDDETPLQIATVRGHAEVERALKLAGATGTVR